jgi:hypothetical protein
MKRETKEAIQFAQALRKALQEMYLERDIQDTALDKYTCNVQTHHIMREIDDIINQRVAKALKPIQEELQSVITPLKDLQRKLYPDFDKKGNKSK